MAMDGIDVSSYQAGIDLSSVPLDFAIVKATEGTGYTNPDCDRAVQQCISLGKCWGVYHYCNGNGAEAEADFFIDQCAGYIGHGILCVDWESGGNSAWGDMGYLGAVVDRIIERTGVKPLVYASASVYDEVSAVAASRDCGMWVAQYPNYDATGYQDSPWNEGAYECVIRQYASTGQLDGWDGSLDLDKAYIDADAWARYAGAQASDVIPEEENAVYRLYNGTVHLWTASHDEAQSLADAGWGYEGVAFRDGSGAPVYRLYNTYTGQHMFTASAEDGMSLACAGWTVEGVAWRCGANVDVHRLYNPNSGEHMFTASEAERDALAAAGWTYEGVAFKAD